MDLKSRASLEKRAGGKALKTSRVEPVQLVEKGQMSAGHSRTVVGLEQRKNGSLCLLLLDPGSSSSDTRKLLSKETRLTAVQFVRKYPRNLKHDQYQLIAVQGVLSPEEKQIRIFNSRKLSAERIP